ncbi:MAG TPA: hypothetical protein VMX54_10245 [Vicinamibacteria bacterium]|nr:hypothetical protein [Vicinamibacteria bacterium]
MRLEKTLRRTPLPVALVALALLPSCSSSTPTVPGNVNTAGLAITVDPTPVVATLNPVTLVATATYKITVTETNGLGGQFNFINGSVFDPITGQLVALNYFDSSDLIVFVGKDRIEPMGTLTVTQTANYKLSNSGKAAPLTVSAQLKDDHSNLVNAAIQVAIQ